MRYSHSRRSLKLKRSLIFFLSAVPVEPLPIVQKGLQAYGLDSSLPEIFHIRTSVPAAEISLKVFHKRLKVQLFAMSLLSTSRLEAWAPLLIHSRFKVKSIVE